MKTTIITTICIFLQVFVFGQQAESWMSLPKEQWPQIALINSVEYKNGDRYLNPSFPYAGTGFLVTYGKDTFAATAKHVLWVARNKKSNAVAVNEALRSWVMKVKGNTTDSTIIGKLLNEDTSEVLDGPQSTIMERDALFFSVQKTSPAIYPLKPRFTQVEPGEKVFFISSDYMDSAATVFEGKILRKQGLDILIERDMSMFRGGASGSPVIDTNGYLVAITSSSGSDAETGKGVAVGISMEYFRDFLAGKSPLNKSKEDYGKLIYETVKNSGVKKAIAKYHTLKSYSKNFYTYNLRTSTRNGLLETGERLIKEKRYKDAIEILKLNVKENSSFFHNYNALAKAYILVGDKDAAIHNYKLSTIKFDDKVENEAFGELKKLEADPALVPITKPVTDTFSSRNGVYLSTDYGMTWQARNAGLPHDVQVSYFEKKAAEIIIATDNYGLFISENKRTRWRNIIDGLPGTKINAVHVSGDEIYAGVFHKGVFLSKDDGKHWMSLNKNLSSLSIHAIIKANSKLIVATDNGIFSKKDDDEQWSNVYSGEQIISLNQSKGKIIAGGLTGVLLSEDGGDNWKQIHKGGAVHYTAVEDSQIFALYMSGDVFKSDNWGTSWSMFTYFPRVNAYIYELTKAGNYLLMSNNYGLFRSENGGKNWDHIYKIEKMIFFDFIVFGNEIYAGTRLAKERRHQKNQHVIENRKMNPNELKDMVISASGLKYVIVKQGSGVIVKEGNGVLIHQNTRYSNDSLLYYSYKSRPIKVLIGGRQAIEGVDEGLRGMKKGEIRKLIVPPALAKRSGNRMIPHPDSTLVYEIELLEIQ